MDYKLSDLSLKELKELKEQWHQQATKDGTIILLTQIAKTLGEQLPANCGPKYLFKDNQIEIYVDCYGGYMTVKVDGKLKVSTHNEKLYAKGEWEKNIPIWVAKMQPIIQQNIESAEEVERKKNIITIVIKYTLMEQLTLEQAATKYGENNGEFGTMEPLSTAFESGAKWQKEQYNRIITLLKGIAEWPGNLPDERYLTKSGPNDAALRGGLVVDMRSIAIEAIHIIEPDYSIQFLKPHS